MKRIDVKIENSQTFGYILYLPDNYSEEKEYPMILCLHGAGERGDGDSDLERVNVHGVARYLSEGTLNFEAIAERISADAIIKMIIGEVAKSYKLGDVEQLGLDDVVADAEGNEDAEVVVTEDKKDKKAKRGFFGRK